MVELRKRKAPAEPAPPPPAKKKSNPIKSAIDKAKNAVGKKASAVTNGQPPSAGKIAVGNTISLEGFGGEVETNDGEKTTLKALVEQSKAGVILFTYPKASTPGCTTQACLFRDSHTPLTSTGLAIYGLSTDSPKSNTTFKTKQSLPYPLLCDPSATLIAAIGLKKAPKGTTRGVFVVDKEGKVLAAEAGGPAATVDVVKKLVETKGDSSMAEEVPTVAEVEKKDEAEKAEEKEEKEGDVAAEEAPKEEAAKEEAKEVSEMQQPPAPVSEEEKKNADVAADVADTAMKLDEGQREDEATADVAGDVADSAMTLDEGVKA